MAFHFLADKGAVLQLKGSTYDVRINLSEESVSWYVDDAFQWAFSDKESDRDHQFGLLLCRLARSSAYEEFKEDYAELPAEAREICDKLLTKSLQDSIEHLVYHFSGDNEAHRLHEAVWAQDETLADKINRDGRLEVLAEMLKVDEEWLHGFYSDLGKDTKTRKQRIAEVYTSSVPALCELVQEEFGEKAEVVSFLEAAVGTNLHVRMNDQLRDAYERADWEDFCNWWTEEKEEETAWDLAKRVLTEQWKSFDWRNQQQELAEIIVDVVCSLKEGIVSRGRTFTELSDLKAYYQAMHDELGLGGFAKMYDDGEGLVAFYNPDLGVWQWWGFDVAVGQYVLTGSTDFIT